jgi:hypothetical protein
MEAVKFGASPQYKYLVVKDGASYMPSTATMEKLGKRLTIAKITSLVSTFRDLYAAPSEWAAGCGSLAEYLDVVNSFYVCKPYDDTRITSFTLYNCTCPQFSYYRTCKHSLGLAIVRQQLNVPRSKDPTEVGKKRGPGRPRKVGHAWEKDVSNV